MKMTFNTVGLFVTDLPKMAAFEPWGQRTCYVSDPGGNLIEIGSFCPAAA